MDPLLLAILLMLLGVTLVILELFIPSGGVIGCVAGVALVASVVVAFVGRGMYAGTAILVSNAVLLAIFFPMAIRIWPRTPIGRELFIGTPQEHEVLPDDEEYTVLQTLVGRRGTVKTDMLPSGIVVIDGEEYDAVSVGVPISPGERIQVVDVETHTIIVRPAAANEPLDVKEPEQDALARPLDSLGLDPFDDPLA